MSLKGWYSKKDVIKDLSKATGVKCDLDEEYVVAGERPPPTLRTLDEEQELHLLRLYGGHKESSPSNMDVECTPDCNGITEMLRMVDQYNDVPEKRAVSETNDHSDTIITISKLNPNVNEFVPSNAKDKELINISTNVNSIVDFNVDRKNTLSAKKNDKTELCAKRSTKTVSVATSSNESVEDIREMRQRLKSKISDTSDSSCVKVKKERNLAIAMLIKLHTQPNTVEKPKLITPDYFMQSLSQKEESDQKDREKSDSKLMAIDLKTQNDNCVFKDTQDYINSPVDMSISDVRKTVNTDSPLSENFNNSNGSYSKEIKESIQKVDDWLNPKNKSVSLTTSSSPKPAAYFGPIKFKRKNNKPSSPVSIETERKVPKANTVFVPSNFASELTKKYEERSKMMENAKQDIWSKVQQELKARDEIIMKKRLETNTDL